MKKLKQILTVSLAAALMLSTAACKSQNTSSANSSKSASTTDFSNATPIKLTVFSQTANFSGTQGGWFAKILKDKFKVTLQIISGQGDGANLYQTRSASGNLGDIIIFGSNIQNFTDSVKANLLTDLTPYLSTQGKYIKEHYPKAISRMKTDYGSGKAVYGLPNSVSANKATDSSDGNDLTYGNYMLWSAYKAAGMPTINTLEDLLPALQKMQKAHPKADNGKKTYGFSLFKDWDGDLMSNNKQYTCLYGYDEWGFNLIKADGSEFQSILDTKGQYYRNLKLYFHANQQGLLDPDSYAQSQSDHSEKLKNGQILTNWWAWDCQSQYNTAERTSNSYKNTTTGVTGADGYVFIPVKDEKIISNGFSPSGVNYEICIGSKCADKARAMALINWMYSPEGVETAFDGPKGLTWNIKDGKPYVTDFGKTALLNPKSKIDSKWGGGTYEDGQDKLNDFKCVAENSTDPTFGEPYLYSRWTSYQSATQTDLIKEWSSKIAGGAKTVHEYCENNNQIDIAPGTAIQTPVLSTSVATTENNVKSIITTYSWKCAMSKTQSEFDTNWNTMVKQAKAAGIASVDSAYKAQWQKLAAARKAAASGK